MRSAARRKSGRRVAHLLAAYAASLPRLKDPFFEIRWRVELVAEVMIFLLQSVLAPPGTREDGGNEQAAVIAMIFETATALTKPALNVEPNVASDDVDDLAELGERPT